MEPPSSPATQYLPTFGPFRIDATERRLYRDGVAIALTPKAFDLLLALAEAPGKLRSRETLLSQVWPDTIVEENNLSWNIRALRKALGDTGETPLYIETVRGHGYRFVGKSGSEPEAGPVSPPIEEESDSGVDAGTSPATAGTPAVPTPNRRRWRLAAGIALLTLAAIAGAIGLAYRSLRAPAASPHSLAVLPFAELARNPDAAYFAAGVQNTILTKLAAIGDLQVMSRAATKNEESHPADARAVATQLGVAALLEGSVQRDGERFRVNVQLIDGGSGNHLWAESYTRRIEDLFDVENEIAEHVAAALKAKLLHSEAEHVAYVPTRDAQAYDDFLKAEYLAEQVGRVGADDMAGAAAQARALYRQAIARDPKFALAWARLAYLDSLAYWFHLDPSPATIAAAEDAAKKALELAPDLPQAHLARGYVHYYRDLDYAAALREFERVRQALPGDVEIGSAIASVQRRMGQVQEAIAGYERIAALDPRNSRWPMVLGDSYAMLRRYDDALKAYDRAQSADPNNHGPALYRTLALLISGDLPGAQRALDTLPAGFDPGGLSTALRSTTRYMQRDADGALAALTSAPEWLEAVYFPATMPSDLLRAHAFALKGDATQAHAAYARARDVLLEKLRAQGEDAHLLSLLGLAEAGLGENDAALANGRRALERFPVSRDAMDGPTYLAALAEIETATGHLDEAARHLRELLRLPAGTVMSERRIALDPRFDAVRETLKNAGDPP
ncbi:winged helix-turn-helix domain-containing protein [Dokdonella sp.]|uniref:winged helix-turn-helix domain-containing protein n=1 Tax=Dokdonella sp. TaxID=2291710 RepID=UPI001B2E976A|nr:winged helix-turn-helix domain-containing protein [Dokdonella sp.]MBO9663027.1 winged helix-turn-helix domain-containing protein [Dokdonella sp.]